MPHKRQRKRAAQDVKNRELVPVQQQESLDRRQLQRQRQQERQQQLRQQQRERQSRQHLATVWHPGIWIDLETGVVEPCAFRWINETLWIRLLIPRRILTRPDWTEELQPEWPRREWPDRIRRPEPEPVRTEHAGSIFVFFILLAVFLAYLASKIFLQ